MSFAESASTSSTSTRNPLFPSSITCGIPPTAVALEREGSAPEAPVPDYGTERVSTKVVKIIQSYTGVVDSMVWRKR